MPSTSPFSIRDGAGTRARSSYLSPKPYDRPHSSEISDSVRISLKDYNALLERSAKEKSKREALQEQYSLECDKWIDKQRGWKDKLREERAIKDDVVLKHNKVSRRSSNSSVANIAACERPCVAQRGSSGFPVAEYGQGYHYSRS
jgi:hypothetical protein